MIPKECFVRGHFWVDLGAMYRPLMNMENDVTLSFQWSDDEFLFVLEESSNEPFQVSFPKFKDKDALILYLDTKPSLKARSMKRHCHQFLIVPEAIEGVQSREITHFNGYDSRLLSPENSLIVQALVVKGKRRYEVRVPHSQLFGYDDETVEVSFAFSYFSHCAASVLHVPIPTIVPEKVPYMWPLVTVKK